MKLSVRRVPAGHPALRELHRVTLPYDVMPNWSESHWWICFDGDKPVAFAGVKKAKSWLDAGYMIRSGVVPSHRGKGLQKRLIRVREAFARRMGWKWLVTDTLNNPASSNSLIACGYRLYEPADPWASSGALYWRKMMLRT